MLFQFVQIIISYLLLYLIYYLIRSSGPSRDAESAENRKRWQTSHLRLGFWRIVCVFLLRLRV